MSDEIFSDGMNLISNIVITTSLCDLWSWGLEYKRLWGLEDIWSWANIYFYLVLREHYSRKANAFHLYVVSVPIIIDGCAHHTVTGAGYIATMPWDVSSVQCPGRARIWPHVTGSWSPDVGMVVVRDRGNIYLEHSGSVLSSLVVLSWVDGSSIDAPWPPVPCPPASAWQRDSVTPGSWSLVPGLHAECGVLSVCVGTRCRRCVSRLSSFSD